MLKILISDHYTIFRIGLIQIIHEAFPEVVIEEANDTKLLLNKVASNKWDMILFGLPLQDDETIKIVRKLKRKSPDSSIIVCGTRNYEGYRKLLFKAGASGYIDKGAKIATMDDMLKETLSARVN